MEGSSKSFVYYDFMDIGPAKSNVVIENMGFNREDVWSIRRKLSLREVQNDVVYIDKEAFWAYILPKIPDNHREKLETRGDLQIMVKDERCVFYISNLTLYKSFCALSSFRNKGQTFIMSRGLGVGQMIGLRWTNGYLEVKVFD